MNQDRKSAERPLTLAARRKLAKRARTLSLVSFAVSLAAAAAGIAMAVIWPFTTTQAFVTTGEGFTWAQRAWTESTRTVTWVGLGTAAALAVIAVAIGLYAHHLRTLAQGGEGEAVLVLKPSADLGGVLAVALPAIIFLAEMISMGLLQLIAD